MIARDFDRIWAAGFDAIVAPTSPQVAWKFGAKRIMSSVNSVCQRLSNLILKVVAKVFPWNRRAKRRLAAKAGADPEAVDDEL